MMAYILEGEKGRVGRRRIGRSISKDVVVICLLVVTMEVILGKAILQWDLCD